MRGFAFEEAFKLDLEACFKRSKKERKQKNLGRSERKKCVVE